MRQLISHCGSALLGVSLFATLSAIANESAPSSIVITNAVEMPVVTITGTASGQTEATAVSVVPGRAFGPGEFADTGELTAIVPSTAVFEGNDSRTPRFAVRGVRENGFLAGSPGVGLYVDDVPYFDLASRGMPLYDISRTSFLRGPQGTLFGASAPGGVINIRTRQAGNDWHGSALAGFGNYESQAYSLSAGGPIARDLVFFDIAGIYGSRDGFVDNLTLGTHPDDQQTFSGRARFTWTPDEHWTISIAADGGKYDDGFVPTFYPGHDQGPFDVYRNLDGHVETSVINEALRISYQYGPLKILSVTAHRDWEQDLSQDFDFTQFQIRDGFSRPELEQWSEELRVQGATDDGKLDWLGGFFFLGATPRSDSGSVEFFPITLDPSGPLVTQPTTFTTLATQDQQTYALFGQATRQITEHFDVIAGLRFTYDARGISRSKIVSSTNALFGGFPIGGITNTFGAYDDDADFTDLQPKLGLVWRFNETAQAYFNFTSAYQSGGFNAASDSATTAEFDPARGWCYEVGAKTWWFEDKLAANLALFLTDMNDYQNYVLSQTDPTQAYVQNADEATLMGVELELAARPLKGLEFHAALGYDYAKYDDYFDAVNGVSLDGKTITFVPQYTLNAGAQYRFDFGLYAHVEVQTVGQYYLTDDNSARQSAFALLNARVGYEGKYWGIYVFGRNLTDTEYSSSALDLRSAFTPDLLILQPGNPRTFGVVVTAKF